MGKENESVKDDVPVRVLHLIDRITGYGTSRVLLDIVRLTPPDKVKHLVITFSPDKGKWVLADRLWEQGAYFPKRGVLRLGRSPMAWFLMRYISTWWYVFKALIWFRPDVIHVHTNYVLTIGLLLKVVLRRPVVHLVPSLFSQMIDEKKTWVQKFYTRFHYFIDCFFSGASQEELRNIGIPESKIFPLRGAIDLQPLQAVREQRSEHHKVIRESLGLPADCSLALSVGRLDPSKGHNFSLEAFPSLVSKFPHLHWVVLGEGKQRVDLEKRAKALGIADHVHLIGYQDNPLPYYAAATVYLRTGIYEAENLSSYQAMAMGLPIVGFDTGCETELLKKVGHGILVPNKSVAGLSAAVAQILTLPEHGSELGGRGIAFSQANLDIRQAIEDMTTVYENLKNGVEVQKNGLVENLF